MSHTSIEPGFIALHSNQSESLAQTVVSWIQAHPLNPLEVEVFLAQSNGMAEWLKMELARMSGVCAATQVELPARFLWRTYRQVLGRGAVPADSPLDKIPMTWRIMQLLPGLIHDPAFAPVNGFLKDDEPDRMLQLATRLADQFDQYQIYRTDWLEDWANGRDHLTTVHGTTLKIPTDQLWQPKLWRAILSTLDTASKEVIRPRLHGRVLQRLESGEPLAGRVARRVVVFCVSQFPLSNLQALATFGSAPLRAAVLDARRGEVYGAVYDFAGALVLPETVGPLPKWLDCLPEFALDFVTGDVELPLAGTRLRENPEWLGAMTSVTKYR